MEVIMKSYLRKLSFLFLFFVMLVGSSAHINAMTIQSQEDTTLFDRITGSFNKLFHGQFNQMDADDYSRIITTTGVAAGVCYGIYWYFFKEHKEQDKSAKRDNAAQHSAHQSLNNNVILKQLRVAGQRGATCGYHALKNGCLVVNALHGYNAATLQHDLLDAHLANRLINQWRGYVNARRRVTNERATGEALFDDEIADLFRIESAFDPLVNPGRGYFGYPRMLQAPCALSTLSENNLNHQGLLDNVRRQFNRRRGPYSHIFILNPGGHWCTVVLHKAANGKREYIAMDTGGLNLRRSAGVKNLIRHIEGAAVANRI
jgi:hypothetical protein